MADLESIVSRAIPPEPWAEGEKIPWNEPAFSERMLAEHLTQGHDAASRRVQTIDAQVAWIHQELLGAEASRVLDLGCGPGLYASRLAGLGHSVRGIDFSPASIRHARTEAQRDGLDIDYIDGDVRETAFGDGFDLAMLIYGELNVFTRDDALAILERARAALRPGGRILIEPHHYASIEARRDQAPSWYATKSGLFSARPHIVLEESFWDEERSVGTRRWLVIDAETGSVERHADAMQAYTDAEYVALLEAAGLSDVSQRPDWPAVRAHTDVLTAYVARA
jgi:SAM-dependent methyltransferase